MRRRNLLLGAGSLLFGSGALSANAAVNRSVEPSADMRVVAESQLIVRAGQAFKDDGTVKSGYTDDYIEFNSGSGDIKFFEDDSNTNPEGLVDIDESSLPVASVNNRENNINGDVRMQVAVPNGVLRPAQTGNAQYTKRFEDILEVVNKTGETVQIGIGYDRDASTWNPNGMYGRDVAFGNNGNDPQNDITERTVQHIFQFEADDNSGSITNERISPLPDRDGDWPLTPNEDPQNHEFVSMDPGGRLDLHLSVNLNDYALGTSVIDLIDNHAELGSSPFTGKDTVDLLDAIAIGTPDPTFSSSDRYSNFY